MHRLPTNIQTLEIYDRFGIFSASLLSGVSTDFIIVNVPVGVFLSYMYAKMRGNLENMTGRSSNFRDYRLLLDGSFSLLMLVYLM